jgi:hypothetical protein
MKYLRIGVLAPRAKEMKKARYAKIVKSAVNTIINQIKTSKSKVEIMTSLRPGMSMDIAKGILYSFENNPAVQDHVVVLTAKVPHMGSMTHQEILDAGYGMSSRELEYYTLMEEITGAKQYNSHEFPDPEIMISDEADIIVMITQGRDKMAEDWEKYVSTNDNVRVLKI